MTSDRWLEHDPSSATAGKGSAGHDDDVSSKTRGINPSSFHTNKKKKKRLHKEIGQSEKQLDDILKLAAHNVIVEKRRGHTSMQNIQREAYHDVTSLRVFPLQELAMDYLDEMMKDYLGGKTNVIDQPSDDMQSKDAPCGDGDSTQQTSRRIKDLHSDNPKAKYIQQFLAEKNCLDNNNSAQSQKLLYHMEPRIFAVEKSNTGKRRYIVGNLGRFLQYYWRDNQRRHYYELIREGTPCRLYFDLEYCKRANQRISCEESEMLMTEFIEELFTEFQQIHGIQIDRSNIVDLDSSTNKKFSRHFIVHLPNGELFADAFSAGVFVKQFVGRLAEEQSTGVLVSRRPTLANHLFVNNQASKKRPESPAPAGGKPNIEIETKKTTCFVDLGVYTRNRLFRLMGSMKYGKPASASLRIADANTFRFPPGFSNSKFYLADDTPSNDTQCSSSPVSTGASKGSPCSPLTQPSLSQDHESFCAALDWEDHACALAMTLVVPANASKTNVAILLGHSDGGEKHMKQSVASTVRRSISTSSRNCSGDSPIPKLDNFILGLSNRGGIQGKIRAWSVESISREGKPNSHYMAYQMSDNRWCENIGRPHRSNNIIWNVDLTSLTVWQTCHDPDCRTSNSRGRAKCLPEEVASDINQYILDQELAELDEDKIISGAANTHTLQAPVEFSNSQLDDELGDLDMSLFKS